MIIEGFRRCFSSNALICSGARDARDASTLHTILAYLCLPQIQRPTPTRPADGGGLARSRVRRCIGWVLVLRSAKRVTDINDLVTKIVEEVSALEARGGEHGAENSDYTFLAAVETAPQFSCPVCGNKVPSADYRSVSFKCSRIHSVVCPHT